MNTPEALYRYFKKIGPTAFYAWLEEHQEFQALMPEVLKLNQSDQNLWNNICIN